MADIGQGIALIHPVGTEIIKAEIYHGHWIGRCANPHCDTAMRLEYGSGYICSGDADACGWMFDVEWPTEETAQAIVAVLMYRPARKNRNWAQPETVLDLMFENSAHGVSMSDTPELGAARSYLALDVSGDGDPQVIVFDEPKTIDAAQPREIEQ